MRSYSSPLPIPSQQPHKLISAQTRVRKRKQLEETPPTKIERHKTSMRYRPTMHAVRPRSRAIPQLPRSIWQTCCNHTRKALTCKSQESISHGGQRWMRERSHGAWRQVFERADRVPCNPSHSRKHQRTTAPSPRRVALGSEPPLCCCAPRNKPTGPRTRLTRATDEATTNHAQTSGQLPRQGARLRPGWVGPGSSSSVTVD